MSEYTVAHLDEIEEITDGREPWRPVRQHFGIMSFGVTSWTGPAAGDRIINEHDEAEEDADEELYLVQAGRARFELDGNSVDAPAGTFVFARPGVKRTAFAEEPGTTIIALGGTPGKAYEPSGWESGRRSTRSTRPASTPRPPTAAASWSRPILRRRVLQPRLLREPGGAQGRCDRAPAPGDRAVGAVPVVRGRRLRLRPDPGRARVHGAGWLTASGVSGGPSSVMSYFSNRAATVARSGAPLRVSGPSSS